MAVSKLAYLTYQTFCLGLLRSFTVNLYPCAKEATHPRDILLPDILLSVIHFLFYLILSFLLPHI